MVKEELQKPSPIRMGAVAKACELGMSVEEVPDLTKVDCWVLAKLCHISCVKQALRATDFYQLEQSKSLLWEAKTTSPRAS